MEVRRGGRVQPGAGVHRGFPRNAKSRRRAAPRQGLHADERRTVVAASEAVKAPPVTVTAVPAARLALDEVTFGVHKAGAVPPAMVIGTVAAAEPLLTATTATVPSVPLKAGEGDSRWSCPSRRP